MSAHPPRPHHELILDVERWEVPVGLEQLRDDLIERRRRELSDIEERRGRISRRELELADRRVTEALDAAIAAVPFGELRAPLEADACPSTGRRHADAQEERQRPQRSRGGVPPTGASESADSPAPRCGKKAMRMGRAVFRRGLDEVAALWGDLEALWRDLRVTRRVPPGRQPSRSPATQLDGTRRDRTRPAGIQPIRRA
jgi:hypothetical protein